MKKNGFTLIELVSVIIILSIIALIAIPAVNKIVVQSRKSAFEVSANNLADIIKYACQLEMVESKTITKKYTFSEEGVSPKLDIKGKLPTAGIATVDDSCNVILNVTNGNFTATKTSSEDSVTVVDGNQVPLTYTVYANGTAVYFNPDTGEKCAAGEAVSTTGTKTGCMKWYTFNDGGESSDTINLILDHNTTAVVAWNSSGSNVSGPTNVLTQLQTDTSSWEGVPTRVDSYSVSNGTATYNINYSTYKARLITAGEVALITGNSSFVEATATNSNWFYLDSNNQTRVAKTTGASNYAWLFDYTNSCTGYGCNIADSSTNGYWTSTAIAGNDIIVWRVSRDGYMQFEFADNTQNRGVRPVITIDKSIL